MNVSVVVPVYNSEDSLELLVERMQPVLEKHTASFELILVDDGSRDDSWRTAGELRRRHDWIRAIKLLRNYGQHSALLCGIRAARHEVIVTIDDDLQHPPEEIPALLAGIEEGFDVVYGVPKAEPHGLWRGFASQTTKLALKTAMGVEVAKNVSAFRAFRTRIRDAFADYHSALVSIDVLLTWGASRFDARRVRHDPRRHGSSNYTFRMLVTHAFNMITGFTTAPLQLASILGLLSASFGGVLLLYVLIRFVLQGVAVPGFAFLASAIALFAGVQLFALGMIGEYLARIHMRTLNKPPYSIDEDLPSAH